VRLLVPLIETIVLIPGKDVHVQMPDVLASGAFVVLASYWRRQNGQA
jgi:hypothetical protein